MGKIKNWLSSKFGAKSYSVQMLVSDEGFMVAQNFNSGNFTTAYTQALWTFICCHRISQDISNIPAMVQVRTKPGQPWQRDPDHELNALLERPYGKSPDAPRWNWQQSIAAGALRQELGGNQFYRVESAGNRLLMLGLQLVEYKANIDPTTGMFESYTPEGGTAIVPLSNIVNVQSASVDTYWRGIPATVANEQATRVNYAASRRMRYDMETRVQAGLIFKIKALFSMNAKQKATVLADMAANYEGAVNAGKSMAVGDDTTIEKPPIADAGDIPAMDIVARDGIISSYQVAPLTVGVLRDSKYSDWDQAMRAQFFLCVSPRLNRLYGTVNSQAITPVMGENVRLWYDLVQSPLGLAALRERGETAKVFMDLGWPAEQVNERFALEMKPFDGWDKPNQPAVVAGRVPGEGSGDDAPEDEPEPEDDDDTEDENE